MGTRNIASLKLSSKARKAAEALLEKHPEVEFTSGLRDLKGQADAMASNVVKNRNWIKQTYATSRASKACQKWVDDNPEATARKDIAAGLHETLKALGKAAGGISPAEGHDGRDLRDDIAAASRADGRAGGR